MFAVPGIVSVLATIDPYRSLVPTSVASALGAYNVDAAPLFPAYLMMPAPAYTNWSIDASKLEQVAHPVTATKPPPCRSSTGVGLVMSVPALVLPTMLTMTPCAGDVALAPTVAWPASVRLLRSYRATGGPPATRTRFTWDP